jgi:subtilisin-like proprotein convertase family protein
MNRCFTYTGLLVGALLGGATFGCSSSDLSPTSSSGSESSESSERSEGSTQTQAAISPAALAQIGQLLAEKAARSPAQRKISSQLLYALQGMPLGAGTQPVRLESTSTIDDRGRVLVDVKGELSPELLERVEQLEGAVVSRSDAHHSLRAWLPLERLEALGGEASVRSIRPALEVATQHAEPPSGSVKFDGVTREERALAVANAVARLTPERALALSAEPIVSEGSRAHAADRSRKFYGTNGSNVRVGVLSDSDDLKEDAIATGDLPADTVTLPGQDGRPGAGEGTAIMEIVHDLAPGAKLFFASGFGSPEAFADNIRALRFSYGCDIIADDLLYFFESPFEDDIVAAAVLDVIADGGTFLSSAGNMGNADDGTSGVWEGDFNDAGALATLPGGYTVHGFGNGVISDRIEKAGGPLFLHWADPGSLDDPASANDYDLFLLDSNLRSVLVASTDIQDGAGLPFEFLGFNVPANYRLVIAKKNGAATRAVRLEIAGGELALATAGATFGHASATGAIDVAAADVAQAASDSGEFFAGPTTLEELYSSDGNRRLFYDRNNVLLHNGATFAGGGGQLRKKPNVTAADGVKTTLPSASGLNPFFGTSAAVGHAAGVAALLKSAVPTITAAKLTSALTQGTLDIGVAGADRDTGSGVVSAFLGLQKAGAKPAVFLELGGVTLTSSSGASIVPGAAASVGVSVVNDGGATATRVSGVLTTTTPGATAGGTAAYPNLAPGAAATNPFALSLASTAACGAPIELSLSVSYTGKGTQPTRLAFSIPTGTPSTVAVPTSYAGPETAIPDGDPAGVSIPIGVADIGRLSKVVLAFDGTACSAAVGEPSVGLDHSWVGDLIVSLTSPSGTTVTLLNRPGGATNSGNNFCNTVLDDAAPWSIQNISASGAPWTGSFKPASPLAAFAGEPSAGTWLLNVVDNEASDTGSVRAFTLALSGYACP